MTIEVPDIIPLPINLGLDGNKFSAYRPNQSEAILEIVDCERRFLLTSMPTGTGKSLTYIVASILGGGRTIIFTANKGLQRQLLGDFSSLVAYVDGRSNHKCALNGLPCDSAPCSTGYKCPFRETPRCDFWAMILRARKSDLVVTNYHFWLSNSNKNNRFILGHFDRIVCDEAHSTVKIILDSLSATLEREEFAGKWIEPGLSANEYIMWISGRLEEIKSTIKYLNEEGGRSARYDIIRFTKLRIKLENLLENYDATNWVIEHSGDSIRFDPIWPATLSEYYLFRGIKQIVMTSATVRPKVMYLLGVKSQDYKYHEYDSIFPVSRRPIMILPTVKVQYDMSGDDIETWLTKIQQIIFRRLDRKGIIHTVSYARCKDILNITKYRDIMMTHNSRNTEEVVKEFKRAKPPRILVSPSVTTGWDFPYCLSPETKILTSGLKWVEAGSLKVDNVLAGFDEMPEPNRRTRLWKNSTVTSSRIVMLPRIKLTLEDGTTFICSPEHKWLVQGTGIMRWVTTKNLRSDSTLPSKIVKLIDVWKKNTSYYSGYLASAFDGEGYITQNFNNWNRSKGEMPNVIIGFTQKENKMLTRVMDFLSKLDYSFDINNKGSNDCITLNISRRSDIIRFLGENRPARLLSKFDLNKMGSLRILKPVKVVKKENVGLGLVVALGTSTQTLIAEGFASHNSECEYQIIGKVPFPDMRLAVDRERQKIDNEYRYWITMQLLEQICGRGMRATDDQCENLIPDGNALWFIFGNKHLATNSFMEAVEKLDMLPDPPGRLAR